MTIAFVRAYSLEEAEEILVYQDFQLSGDLLEYGSRVAWIGFEPRGPSPARNTQVCRRSLVLAMTDSDPVFSVQLIGGTAAVEPLRATPAHAVQIVRFLEALQAEPDEWAVAVHCTAGIGRSGSVSRYVQDRWKPLSEERWKVLHLRCHPREWFVKMLREAEASDAERRT